VSILITAANSAHAYQLKSLLGVDALLGDYLDIPDLMVRSGKMIKTPNPGGVSFAHQMLTLCLDKGVTTIYPLRRAECLPLAEARQLFTEFGISLCIPEKEMIELSLNTGNMEGSLTIRNDGVFKISADGQQQIFTAD
jgi:hypothetical protein